MTYQDDFTLPTELLEQISEQGLGFLPELIRIVINSAMQAERQQHLGVGPYERSAERTGWANGFKPKTLTTRLAPITFAVPQVREILTTYEPEAWSADFNVYDPMGTFSWQRSSPMGMRAWQEQSGGDAGSARCRPGFVDPEGGDFHLLATDTCARGSGAVLDIEAIDFDGDPRPVGRPVDIGADQVADQAGPSSR